MGDKFTFAHISTEPAKPFSRHQHDGCEQSRQAHLSEVPASTKPAYALSVAALLVLGGEGERRGWLSSNWLLLPCLLAGQKSRCCFWSPAQSALPCAGQFALASILDSCNCARTLKGFEGIPLLFVFGQRKILV